MRCIKGVSVASLVVGSLLVAAALVRVEAEDKIKDLIRSSGIVEVKLIEAEVPDMDPLPGQKDSDVFVRVSLDDSKVHFCESKTVQDDNHPKFSKECRTNTTVPSTTVLRFELFDSDNPSPSPDWIGMARVRVADLILNRKLDSKESFPIEGRQFPKYYIKAKIDFKPLK